jgi:23S rRNA (guanine745-N1)-methyltransferase
MCRARREFLSAEYYGRFADAIANELYNKDAKSICDAGCGEGYYSRKIRSYLPKAEIIGLDLAKTTVKLASRSEKSSENPIRYAVAGIFDMPLPDRSFDALISVFAPVPESEAFRILNDDGIMIVAHPGKHHLNGLKSLIYNTPYDNEESITTYCGFEHLYDTRVKYDVTVLKDHVSSLFHMTPYYLRTSKSDADKLKNAGSVHTDLDFIISVYKKTSESENYNE